MMFGALVLRKLLSLGLSSIVEVILHKLESTIQLLFVRLVVQQAWWLYLVDELQIKVVYMILGAWEGIEMEDGTG